MSSFSITVGETTFVCSDGHFVSELNKPDAASGTVAAADLERGGVDWLGLAHASIDGDILVHGRVVEARPTRDGTVTLCVRGSTMLRESQLPPMTVQMIDGREVVYMAARSAGFDIENINIDGLAEAVDFEPLWVLAPVRGLTVSKAAQIGAVEFVDGDAGRDMLRRFTPPLESQFMKSLSDVGAFARVAVPAKYMYDAELEGLQLIDDACAWLTVRLRYSWSHTPEHQLELYERLPGLVVVERLPGVAVFPLAGSGRRWWRDATIVRQIGSAELSPRSRWLAPPMPTQMSPSDRQAVLALQRATTTWDSVQRVAALWEAIEFYIADRTPDPRFDPIEIDAAVERASKGLQPEKAKRVATVLKQWLNSWSPMDRLEHVLREDGVPFCDEDMRRIGRLRRVRNRAIHGASTTAEHDDIECAIALMSRAIVTRSS